VGECNEPSNFYNPFDLYNRFRFDLIDESRLLADSMVVQTNSDNQKYWEEEARNVIMTIILYLIDRDGCFDSSEISKILSLGKDELNQLFENDFFNRLSYGGIIARGAHQLIEKSNAEYASVMASVRQNCTVLDSEAVSASMKSSSFSFSQLKDELSTVYIVIPLHKLSSNIRWLRLIISSAVSELQRTGRGKHDVLFIIDEFAALGSLETLANSFSYMAGYGVKLWPIVQDLSQLQAAYPKLWQSLIANAGVLQYFGTRDLLTANYISEMSGFKTVRIDDDTNGANGVSRTKRSVQRNVLFPHEVMSIDASLGIAFIDKTGPVMFEKIRYFRDQEYSSLVSKRE
jgi:type IV secretion system protein VirD4